MSTKKKEPTLKLHQLSASESKTLQLPEQKVTENVKIEFKLRTYRYGYYYSQPFIRVSADLGTIKAEIPRGNKKLTLSELNEFMDWVKQNASWHKITVAQYTSSSKVVQDAKVPAFPVGYYTVSGQLHLPTTPKQTAQITKLIEGRKATALKKRQADAAKRAAEKKAEQRERARDAAFDHADLAMALSILKKNGLKVITVEEKGKK